MLPEFKEKHVGAYNSGFVIGKNERPACLSRRPAPRRTPPRPALRWEKSDEQERITDGGRREGG